MTFAASVSSHIDNDEEPAFSKRQRMMPIAQNKRSSDVVRAAWRRMSDVGTHGGRLPASNMTAYFLAPSKIDWDVSVGTHLHGCLTICTDMPSTFARSDGIEAYHSGFIPMKALVSPPLINPFYSILMHLERLSDGWNGPGSEAPSYSVIQDVSRLLQAFDSVRLWPEIEVDDDGTVVLEWRNGERAFALSFTGNGFVVGTVSPGSAAYPAWRIKSDEKASITDKLSEQSLNGFVREA